MCFFSTTTHCPYASAATQRADRGVQLPWPARSLANWTRKKWGLIRSPEPVTIIVELRQRVQDAWDNLLQDGIRCLYGRFLARLHACVAARGDTMCIDVTVLAPLTVTCVSFGLMRVCHAAGPGWIPGLDKFPG